MIAPAEFSLTYQQKKARALEKKAAILGFLASGEVWTTAAVAAELLDVSERTALRVLNKMEVDHLVKTEEGLLPSLKIFGISAHGLAMCENTNKKSKEFSIGKTNPSFIQHHLNSQKIQIRMKKAGWTDFVAGKILMVENKNRLKKLPDFIATRPSSKIKVAGEIEHFTKSTKRLADIMGAHLSQIAQGHYQIVYYFTPHPEAQARAFEKIEYVFVQKDKVKLTDAHRQRFKIFDLNLYKGEI